jgi:hypothetical protein
VEGASGAAYVRVLMVVFPGASKIAAVMKREAAAGSSWLASCMLRRKLTSPAGFSIPRYNCI